MRSDRRTLSMFALMAVLAAARSASATPPDPIFANDFETGTSCHWDATAPTVYCWANPAGGEWYTGANWKGGVYPPEHVNAGIDLDGPVGTVTIAGAFPYVKNFTSYALIMPTNGRQLTVEGVGNLNGGFMVGAGGGGLTASGPAAIVTVTGPTSFTNGNFSASGTGHLTLATMTTVANINSQNNSGGIVTLSALTSITGGGFLLVSGAGTEIDAPNLQSISGLDFVEDTGAVLNAPALTSYTMGTIQFKGATSTFSAPNLATITDTEILVSSSGNLSLPAVTSYLLDISECDFGGCYKFAASGPGAMLSLPNLETIVSTGSVSMVAGAINDGGQLDLSGVKTITTSGTSTATFYAIGTGSAIDLTALTTYDGTHVTFAPSGGGQIHL